MKTSRSEAFFWCGYDGPTSAQIDATTARLAITEIAEIAEATRERIAKPLYPDLGRQELADALFVLQQLEDVLNEWPEYWNSEYMAEMAED